MIWLNQFYYRRQDDEFILWTENADVEKKVESDAVDLEVEEA